MEWSEWKNHLGGGCPVPVGTVVHAIYHAPNFDLRKCEGADHPSIIEVGRDYVIKPSRGCGDVWDRWIVRYRFVVPPALKLLNEICASPERQHEAA